MLNDRKIFQLYVKRPIIDIELKKKPELKNKDIELKIIDIELKI